MVRQKKRPARANDSTTTAPVRHAWSIGSARDHSASHPVRRGEAACAAAKKRLGASTGSGWVDIQEEKKVGSHDEVLGALHAAEASASMMGTGNTCMWCANAARDSTQQAMQGVRQCCKRQHTTSYARWSVRGGERGGKRRRVRVARGGERGGNTNSNTGSSCFFQALAERGANGRIATRLMQLPPPGAVRSTGRSGGRLTV
eukprot:366485-Chlamydomonas_euryale.AAC.4